MNVFCVFHVCNLSYTHVAHVPHCIHILNPPHTHTQFVPYSLHSSYAELIQFVTALRPSKITPLLSNADLDPARHCAHLLSGEDWVCVMWRNRFFNEKVYMYVRSQAELVRPLTLQRLAAFLFRRLLTTNVAAVCPSDV